MRSPERGRWCEQHQRWECVADRHRGAGPCHSPRMVGDGDKCRMHLGRKAAEVIAETEARQAVVTYGLPRDISPTEALLEEVRYTAGHVAWLRGKVQEIEQDKNLVWGVTEQVKREATEFPGVDSTVSARPNVWLELYYRERKHLVDVTKAAISAGIEERRVKIAEAQGALLVKVIRGILDDLGLSAEQQARVQDVVPRHLRAVA